MIRVGQGFALVDIVRVWYGPALVGRPLNFSYDGPATDRRDIEDSYLALIQRSNR